MDDRHWNALNLVFRLIYPPCATFLALLFVRFFPAVYLPNLAVVHGLNRPPTRVGAGQGAAQHSAHSEWRSHTVQPGEMRIGHFRTGNTLQV